MDQALNSIGTLSLYGLVLFFLGSFALGGLLGFVRFRSGAWHWVDLIYYPLAALGVVLFFLAQQTQRDMLEASRIADEKKKVLLALKAEKPSVERFASEEIFERSLEWVRIVRRWGEICPVENEPKCYVSRDLFAKVDAYLKIAGARYESHQMRLARTCAAGDRLLSEIANDGVLSAPIARGMVSSYLHINAGNFRDLYYGDFSSRVAKFRSEASKRSLDVLRIAFPSDVEGKTAVFMRQMDEAEIEFAGMILEGLYPCAISEKSKLQSLVDWRQLEQSREDEVRRAETELERLGNAMPDPLIQQVQLNLWPLLIILALSLKFAKGVAGLRKHAVDAGKPKASSPSVPAAESHRAGSSGAEPPPAVEGFHEPQVEKPSIADADLSGAKVDDAVDLSAGKTDPT